jgi:hypothetical protein
MGTKRRGKSGRGRRGSEPAWNGRQADAVAMAAHERQEGEAALAIEGDGLAVVAAVNDVVSGGLGLPLAARRARHRDCVED